MSLRTAGRITVEKTCDRYPLALLSSSFFVGDHNRVLVRLDSGEDVELRRPLKPEFMAGKSIGLVLDRENLTC